MRCVEQLKGKYSHWCSKDGDRLWRKTRSDQSDSPGCPADECNGRGCFGVDPNRNWDDHWGYSGVSANVCDENYLGETPFSEAETQNLRDYYESIDPQPSVAILFHSAAEQWLYAYGWDYNQYPDNVDEVVSYT